MNQPRKLVGGHDAKTPTLRATVVAGGLTVGISVAACAGMCAEPPRPPDVPPPPPPTATVGTETVSTSSSTEGTSSSTTGSLDPFPPQPEPPLVECDALRMSQQPKSRTVRKSPSDRIVGGAVVPPEDYAGGRYAFAASIQWKSGNAWSAYCGGSVAIRQDLVLTAAHCRPELSDRVVVGRHDLRGNSGRVFGIKEVWVHAKWNKPVQHNNDFALVQLDGRTDVVPVIVEVTPTPWPLLTAVGWGATSEGGPQSPLLKFVDVPMHDTGTCSAAYSDATARMGCAGVGLGDSCQGDSGGFYGVQLTATQFMAIGATSFGSGCNRPNDPGFFAYYAGDGGYGAGWVHACAREAVTP